MHYDIIVSNKLKEKTSMFLLPFIKIPKTWILFGINIQITNFWFALMVKYSEILDKSYSFRMVLYNSSALYEVLSKILN